MSRWGTLQHGLLSNLGTRIGSYSYLYKRPPIAGARELVLRLGMVRDKDDTLLQGELESAWA